MLNIHDLGKVLARAGHLKLRPLCVYGTDEAPHGSVPSYAVDRCLAKAVYISALFEETPPFYIAGEGQSCPGGMLWMGFSDPHPKLKYFVTVGTPDFHGGAAEHLKASPELFEEQRRRVGKITPPDRYIVVAPCDGDIEMERVRSVVIFAGSEQIRNLCGLAQFSSSDPFFKAIMPAGAACCTMITYPAGMAENAPKDSVYVGPTDPTVNPWLPPDLMVMGVPVSVAQQMASDLEESFISRRKSVAYPETRSAVRRRTWK